MTRPEIVELLGDAAYAIRRGAIDDDLADRLEQLARSLETADEPARPRPLTTQR